MGRRLLRCFALAVALLACSDQEASPDRTEPPTLAPVDIVALQEEFDADQVIEMIPGGSAPMPQLDPGVDVLGFRHVLRAVNPDGRIDVFTARLRGLGGGDEIQDCQVTVHGGGYSMSCDGPPGGPPGQQESLITTASSDGAVTMFDLLGPSGTTHFVVDVGERRVLVIPVEGQAVLTVAGEPCRAGSQQVQAWNGDELLRESASPDWC